MVISLRPPGQTEEEKGSVKGEKTETDWLLLSKDLHFSNEGSIRANSHKLVVPSHPTLPSPCIHSLKSTAEPSRLPMG